MNHDLKQLIRLQTSDLAIQELRTRIDKFPGISKALDEKLRSAQAALESAKEKAKSNLSNRKKLESEISSIESKISKYRDQMMAVKTNDEYRALQHEIEHAQNAIRKIEVEVLNWRMEAKWWKVDIKAVEPHWREIKQKVDKEESKHIEQTKRDR